MQAKTDAYIVDRVRAALAQLKKCRSQSEWLDYSVVLAAVAPERETTAASQAHRNDGRSISKVFARLGVQQGKRYVKATGQQRARAPDRAITRRAAFDEDSTLVGDGRLKAGDAASSHGRTCTVIEIDYDADTCTLAFEAAGLKLVRKYSCIYKGKERLGSSAPFPKCSARLCYAPPSLRPLSRHTRKDAKAEAARPS